MVKAAQQLTRAEEYPATVRIGKACQEAPEDIAALVDEGWRVKQQLDKVKARLEEITERLGEFGRERLEACGVLHVLTVRVDCAVTLKDRVEIVDADELRQVLGRRFADLVRERVAYAPERRLIDLAVSGDSALSGRVRELLRIRPAQPGVAFRPR